MKHMSG